MPEPPRDSSENSPTVGYSPPRDDATHSGGTGDTDGPQHTLGKRLKELELVDEATFTTVCQALGSSEAPETILDELERRGKLTKFQLTKLKDQGPESLRFDEYVLIDKLGEGGMGEVFRAYNLMLGRVEAIKTLLHFEGGEAGLIKRFQQEARVLARLEHPAIVPIYKVGRFGTIQYIAMKYVAGEDLRQKVRVARETNTPIPVATATRWIADAADALGYAHRQGVIHRDIKPGNLMIASATDQLIVLDMGIARLADQRTPVGEGLTQQSRGLGTPEFMPPEQWADARAVTPSSDFYALGCTLYYILVGRPPFQHARMVDLMRAHATENVPRLSAARPDVPAALDRVLARMMAKHPDERYADGAELANDLRASLLSATSAPTKAMAIPAQKRAPVKPPARRGAMLAAGAFFGALLSLGAWLWFRTTPKPVEKKEGTLVVDSKANSEVPTQTEKTSDAPSWLVEYQIKHHEEWPDLGELAREATEFGGADGMNPALAEPGGALHQETMLRARRILRRQADSWLAEHRAANPGIWRDADEIEDAAGGLSTLNRLSSAEDLEKVKQAIEAETKALQNPFANLKPGDLPPDWVKEAIDALRRIVSLFVVPPDPDWSFTANFVDDNDQPVAVAQPRAPVHLRYVTSRAGYVTFVIMDEWTLSILKVKGTANAGEEVVLSETMKFAERGIKRVFVFATPGPLVESTIPPIINPEEKVVQRLFATERVHARIVHSLRHGERLPGTGGKPAYDSWAFATIELEVRP